MDERVVVPSTSVLLVAVVGMAAGHLLMPARPAASTAGRALFAAAVLASGALAGWRTARVLRRAGRAPSSAVAGIGGAAGATLLAWLAWLIVHG